MSQASLKQENFEIKEIKRKEIVRQDRYEVPQKSAYLTIYGSKLEVLNVTPFGAALLVKENAVKPMMEMGEVRDCEFEYFGGFFQTVHLKPVRSEPHQCSVHNDWIVGCEIIGEPLNVEKMRALEGCYELIQSQNKYAKKIDEVPEKFRALVFEFKNWLVHLKEKVDSLSESIPTGNSYEENTHKSAAVEAIGRYLGQVVPAAYSKIPSVLQESSVEQRDAAIEFLRDQIGSLIYGAPFAQRAYFKPRGYAGDYEMMNHLYRNERVGKSLFDQCMHRYFIDEPAGQAVKNRGQYLLEKITELPKKFPHQNHFRLISIASGPAMEVQMLLEKRQFPDWIKFEFHFIDQDEESLKHAQRQLRSIERFVNSGYEFNFHNLAIKNIIGRGIPGGSYDLVYSAGLFDYFTDPVATAAATRFVEATNESGSAIIGNFSTNNPCTVFMDMALDWQLIYRSVEDLHRIFGPAASNVVVEKEPLGINLFAILKRK